MSTGLQEYRHSGQLGTGTFLLPIVGLLSASVLGFIYGAICVYNPIAGWITFLIAAAFGLAMAWVISKCAIAAHCRNVNFVRAVAAFTGLAGIYICWASFIYFIAGRGTTQSNLPPFTFWLSSPGAIWGAAESLATTGYFNIHGATPTGIVLWILWLIEVGIIMVVVLAGATMGVEEAVYCESCRCWAKVNKGFATFGDVRAPSMIESVKGGDLSALSAAPFFQRGSSMFLRMDNQVCERCKVTETTQLVRVTLTKDDKGNVTENLTEVTGRLLLDDAAKLTLAQTLAKRQQDEAAQNAANIEAAKKKEAERKAAIEAKKAPPPENESKA